MPISDFKLKSLTKFEQDVLQATQKIPVGQVTTYGILARVIKNSGSARAVGNALHKNPCAPQLPCHRIVKSDGTIGGYAGGVKNKIQLLKKEGVGFTIDNKIKNLDRILYEFK